jgi:hypothetical protein
MATIPTVLGRVSFPWRKTKSKNAFGATIFSLFDAADVQL